jgi:cytochrome c biogenesis protein ResB
MKANLLTAFFVLVGTVLFSYGTANAQVVDAAKDAASKTKDVTVKTAKKTSVVVTDALDKAADKTAEAAKVGASKTKSFGTHTVNVTDNVAGQAYEGGRWFMVTTWDGAKWVSKRTWFPDKKH